MVTPTELACAFDGPHFEGFFDYADAVRLTARVRADVAQLGFRKVATSFAGSDASGEVVNRLGQLPHRVLGTLK